MRDFSSVFCADGQNSLKRSLDQRLGYEHLCLAKRPHPAKPLRILLLPVNVLLGLRHLRRAICLADCDAQASLEARAGFYRADLLHSWASLLLLAGPGARRLYRAVFGAIEGMYASVAEATDLMAGGYYWLRHLEAKLFAGMPLDRDAVEDFLDELDRSYQLVQNNVQIGNTHAYRGIVAYLLGDGPENGRRDAARQCFLRALEAWEGAAEGVSSGQLRLVLFRRFVGEIGFLRALREFMRHM